MTLIIRIWRICATACGFIFIFVGGFILATVIIPTLSSLFKSKRKKEKITSTLLQLSFRFFLRFLDIVGVIQFPVVRNIEKLHQGATVVIANHPCLIDVIALISILPEPSCIVKSSLIKHRFFGGVIRRAGFIPNDDGSAMLQGATQIFHQNRPLIVFPEGTRSSPQGMNSFKNGAARIAIHCNVPISPVVIHFGADFLRKEDPWYKVPNCKVPFEIEFLETIWPKQVIKQSVEPSRAVRTITRYIQDYYVEKTNIPIIFKATI